MTVPSRHQFVNTNTVRGDKVDLLMPFEGINKVINQHPPMTLRQNLVWSLVKRVAGRTIVDIV
jgi:hypothetical protein